MIKKIIPAFLSFVITLTGCSFQESPSIKRNPDNPDYIKTVESLLKDTYLDEDIRQILERISYEEIPETSHEKIDKDLQTGAITEEESVKLTLWASFGDSRLPAKYIAQPPDMNISINRELLWISDNLKNMDKDSRAFFEPYILPPDDPDSYFYPGDKKNSGSLRGFFAPEKAYAAEEASIYDFKFYEYKCPISSGKAGVYYYAPKGIGSSQEEINRKQAENTRKVLEKAWPAFYKLLGEEPKQRIKIYFSHELNIYGMAAWNYDEQTAIITIRSDLFGDILEATVAHELFHVFQFYMGLTSFSTNKDLLWLLEATAVWSENFIYPNHNTEYEFNNHFFKTLDREAMLTGGGHEYGRYMFFRFLSQYMGSDEYVPKLLKAAKTGDIRKKIMDNIPNYGDIYSEFALYNWNSDPWQIYRDDPPFPSIMPSGFALMVSEVNKSGEDDEWNCILDKGAAQYHMFVFNADPVEIKRVKFDFNQEASDQYLRRKALVKIGDVWELESWNTITSREFCRDRPEENVKSVILILSNADLINGGNIPYTVETRGECPKTIKGYTKIIEKATVSGVKTKVAELISNDTIEYDLEEDAFVITRRQLSFTSSDSAIIPMPDGKTLNSLISGSGNLIENYIVGEAPVRLVLDQSKRSGRLIINPDTINTEWVTFHHSLTGTDPFTEKGNANFLFVDSVYDLKENEISDTAIKGRYVWHGDSTAAYAEVIIEFEYDLP